MDIIYTATAYPPSIGGAQIHLHQIAKALNTRHSIQVCSFWDENRFDWLLGTTLHCDEKPLDYEIDGISVHKIGLTSLEKKSMVPWVLGYYPLMPHAIPKIARLIQNHLHEFTEKATLIHNVRIGREPISYASLYEARRKDIPFVFTPVHHPRWSRWLYRHYIELYKKADAVIALTKSEKDELIRLGVSEDKIFITGIGPVISKNPDPESFRQLAGTGNSPIILFLGQKYPYKGVKELLDAAHVVWSRHPDVFFAFIGPHTKYSEKLFLEYKDPRIIEMGAVDLETKSNALAACEILCVPSTQESFGGVYTEAWSLGRPVIGCNIPAVSQVIKDCENGFLVNQDPSEIADRIIALLLDKKLSESFGKNGKREVQQKYSWERLAKLTEEVYRTCL